MVYVTRHSTLFVSSDITLLPWLILAQTYRRLVNISLISELMISQSGIHCCPVLDNFGKKGCRGPLAVFGARSNRLARWRLHKQRGKHLAGTRPPRRSLALHPIPDGASLNLCYRRKPCFGLGDLLSLQPISALDQSRFTHLGFLIDARLAELAG
jgi:hypothetical protein